MDFDSEQVASVLSREELRFQYLDEQGWDESCGYAALASLLSRYRNLPVTEAGLLALSVPEDGKAVKVSLAELVRLTRGFGLEARPWRTVFEDLPQLSAPLLAHYDRPQGHFALVLAAGPEGVVTADPARGLELLTRRQFLERWSGIVLEVVNPKDPGSGREVVEKAVKSVLARQALVERALSKAPPKR